jgi:hypothetical protein
MQFGKKKGKTLHPVCEKFFWKLESILNYLRKTIGSSTPMGKSAVSLEAPKGEIGCTFKGVV